MMTDNVNLLTKYGNQVNINNLSMSNNPLSYLPFFKVDDNELTNLFSYSLREVVKKFQNVDRSISTTIDFSQNNIDNIISCKYFDYDE